MSYRTILELEASCNMSGKLKTTISASFSSSTTIKTKKTTVIPTLQKKNEQKRSTSKRGNEYGMKDKKKVPKRCGEENQDGIGQGPFKHRYITV